MPLPGWEFDGDCAADLLGEAEHLAEAEAGPFTEGLGGEERLEHAVHRFGVHALAVVGDAQGDKFAAKALGLALQNLVARR